jgi:hypothetical protein
MEAMYEKVAENVRCFVPLLEKRLAYYNYGLGKWSVTVESKPVPRAPFTPRPVAVLRAQLWDRDNVTRRFDIHATLFRTASRRGVELDEPPLWTHDQFINFVPPLSFSASTVAAALNDCDRSITIPCVLGWWRDVWRFCFDRQAEKAREVARYKEELAAAVWHPRRVEAWLAAGVELEAL